MMVTSLLPVLGALLKQLFVTLLIPFTVSLSAINGEPVTPRQYAGMMAESVSALRAYGESLGVGTGLSVSVSTPAVGEESPDSPKKDKADNTNNSNNTNKSDNTTTPDNQDTKPLAGPRKMAKNISSKIDSIVVKVEPKVDADSLLDVTIGLPVPDRTNEEVTEAVTSAISSFDSDWDYDGIEKVAMIVTLIVTVICFGIPFLTMIVIIGLILNSRVKYQRERLRVIENIVTSGHPVPTELRGINNDPEARRNNFSSALKWIGVGLVLTLFFGLLTGSRLAVVTFGIVPLVVGAVKLALFFYDSRLAHNATEGGGDDVDYNGEYTTRVFPPQFTGLPKRPAPTDHSRYMPPTDCPSETSSDNPVDNLSDKTTDNYSDRPCN